MQFQVNGEYQKGVEEFQWHAEEVKEIHSPIYGQTLKNIIDDISNRILTAQRVSEKWGNPPLHLAMIKIQHNQDITDLKSTLQLILKASPEEKRGLKFVCQELSKKQKNLSETDLKCATLLFGLELVHNYLVYWNSR